MTPPTSIGVIALPDRTQFFWLFFRISGRVSRPVYFLAGSLLFVVQLFFAYRLTFYPEGSPESAPWLLLFLIVALICVWSNFALTAKRFHDFGKPAGYAAISLILGFILVVILAFINGDPGPNQYGERSDTVS